MQVNCSRFVSSIFTFKGRFFCSMEEWEIKRERWGNACSRHFALSTLNKLSITCITDVVPLLGPEAAFSTVRKLLFLERNYQSLWVTAITVRHLVWHKMTPKKSLRPLRSPVTLSCMIRGSSGEAQPSLVYIVHFSCVCGEIGIQLTQLLEHSSLHFRHLFPLLSQWREIGTSREELISAMLSLTWVALRCFLLPALCSVVTRERA